MTVMIEYEKANLDAERARLKKILALRAMLEEGQSQREIAKKLGVTQPAISYQVAKERTDNVKSSQLIDAGASVLKQVAQNHGFTDLAVFGSAARGDDSYDSDLDLIALPPEGADLFDFIRLEDSLAKVAGRKVDLVSYRGLNSKTDHDILQDKVLL